MNSIYEKAITQRLSKYINEKSIWKPNNTIFLKLIV